MVISTPEVFNAVAVDCIPGQLPLTEPGVKTRVVVWNPAMIDAFQNGASQGNVRRCASTDCWAEVTQKRGEYG